MTRSFHAWVTALALCATPIGCGKPEQPTAAGSAPTSAVEAQVLAGSDAATPAADSTSMAPAVDSLSALHTAVDAQAHADTTTQAQAEPARTDPPLAMDDDAVIAAYVAITCAQKAGRAAQLASLYQSHALADRTQWQSVWKRASSDAGLVRRATEQAAATCP